ncbi:MAG: TonB-dependent receptor [Desulfatitalea sp.]
MRDEYYSVGLEDTITLAERWSALVGASYDWQMALEAEDYSSTTGLNEFPTKNASAFNPQAGLFYDISDSGTIYTTVARKSRFATLKDRYSYRFGRAIPNPELDPEISTNYDLGYKATLSRITFKTAGFFYDVQDYIQLVTIPNPANPATTLQQNQNIGEVYLFGAEAEAAIRFTRTLDGGLGYTYTDWDNRSNDQMITNVPKHKINAFLHYLAWDRLGLTVYATHYAGRYSSSNGVRETDSFTVADFKASYRIAGDLKIEGGVNNIFDKNYEIEEGYPEEGVNYFANLTYRY